MEKEGELVHIDNLYEKRWVCLNPKTRDTDRFDEMRISNMNIVQDFWLERDNPLMYEMKVL